jgi:hypothetical protein
VKAKRGSSSVDFKVLVHFEPGIDLAAGSADGSSALSAKREQLFSQESRKTERASHAVRTERPRSQRHLDRWAFDVGQTLACHLLRNTNSKSAISTSCEAAARAKPKARLGEPWVSGKKSVRAAERRATRQLFVIASKISD